MTVTHHELPALVLPPAVLEGADVVGWVLDELTTADVEELSDEQLRAAVTAWAQVCAGVEAVKLRLLARAEQRGTARAAGAASTGAWAAQATHEDPAETTRQVQLATGLDRRCPTTQTALAQGRLTTKHAAVIVEAERHLPPTLGAAERERVEVALVAKAQTMTPQRLRQAARRALETVERDTTVVDAHEDRLLAAEETAAYARARLSLHQNGDGTVTGHFTVPDLHGQLLRKILESMTAPRRARLGASHAQTGERTGPHTDWDHARGQAFCELLEHLPTGRLHSKVAATLVVTIDHQALTDTLRAAGLDTGAQISAGQARRLACGAGLLPAVLDGASQPLDLGRTKRLFSEAQRVAVGLSHQTCAAEGCERPYAWCELHHRRPWSREGPTDLAAAIPLCWFHHRRIHDTAFAHRERSDGAITFHRRP